MASVVLNGATSGQITLAPAAVAGTNTITFPASTGTVLVTSGGAASFSNIVLNGSSSGSTTLQPSATASGTVTLPAGTGTAAVQGVSTNIVSGTAQASTSGTAITFTGIPSWAKRITVMLSGVSTSSTSNVQIQIGSGSATISGYKAAATTANNSNVTGFTAYTSGFGIDSGSPQATTVRYGVMTIVNLSGNTWCAAYNGWLEVLNFAATASGAITLSGVLDRVILTTINGTDTFDAGSINILYE
jgi:hypothetical protein